MNGLPYRSFRKRASVPTIIYIPDLDRYIYSLIISSSTAMIYTQVIKMNGCTYTKKRKMICSVTRGIPSTWLTMSCDTTWIIRHELVYFGPFSVGLFSGRPIFGKCPKPKISPGLIFGPLENMPTEKGPK